MSHPLPAISVCSGKMQNCCHKGIKKSTVYLVCEMCGIFYAIRRDKTIKSSGWNKLSLMGNLIEKRKQETSDGIYMEENMHNRGKRNSE